jgi:hypothetical protein
MAGELNESDWKIFRRLHKVTLERFCERVIDEIKQASSDMRRSRALVLLTNIRRSGLLTDEEFSQFSPEARARVESILEVSRR